MQAGMSTLGIDWLVSLVTNTSVAEYSLVNEVEA